VAGQSLAQITALLITDKLQVPTHTARNTHTHTHTLTQVHMDHSAHQRHRARSLCSLAPSLLPNPMLTPCCSVSTSRSLSLSLPPIPLSLLSGTCPSNVAFIAFSASFLMCRVCLKEGIYGQQIDRDRDLATPQVPPLLFLCLTGQAGMSFLKRVYGVG